ncbi:hypothetical protein AB0N05_22400 [Nocardia sp. NPDC051030]|uniref:hypothetical protein n=1 Tax=Nocardia sp. NPDC051030 TaxID=3155162 RepID=UPI00341A93B9
MGGSNVLGVDTDALRGAAATLRDCSATLDQQARLVTEHAFGIGNDQAGRNYSKQGAAIHTGFEHIAACLRNWSTAAATTSAVFDSAAKEYDRIDADRAAAVTAVQP